MECFFLLLAVKFILFVLKCLAEVALRSESQSSDTTAEPDSEVTNEAVPAEDAVEGMINSDVVVSLRTCWAFVDQFHPQYNMVITVVLSCMILWTGFCCIY